MPPTKPPRETPNALQAFEDFAALGPDGSLQKLAARYRQRSDNGESVPTKRLRTLGEWSTQHHWQDRVKQRIAEEEELVREETRKRAAALRKRLMTAIEADMSLYAQKVGRGEAVLAEDAASLERMTKLYFQLAGDPLAEKMQQEHTGPNGGPMQVQTEHSGSVDLNAAGADPELAGALCDFARQYARRKGDPAGLGNGAHGAPCDPDGDTAAPRPAEPEAT